MSEKDIQKLIELTEARIHEGVSADEALKSLVNAGILNLDGEYTTPYAQMLTLVEAE
jgi:hypothetical protein